MIYDIAGIGIGPFNLGLAALLEPVKALKSVFLEQKQSFDWHPGMMIPGATLQVPFYADLVTLADPASRFNFFCFLKAKNKLIRFGIYDNNYISRKLYNDYCNWVAAQLNNLYFNTSAQDIQFNKAQGCYEITANSHGCSTTVLAKHIVIGIGSSPYLPACTEGLTGNQIFHSSDYLYGKATISGKDSVALIGSGQSAAEIFYDLLEGFPQSFPKKLNWFTRSARFFPMDFSRLSLEMTSPDYIRYFYHLPAHIKKGVLKSQDMLYKGINRSLVDRIYQKLYELQEAWDDVPVQLRTNMELRSVVKQSEGYGLRFLQTEQGRYYEDTANIVILATGYAAAQPCFLNGVKHRIKWSAEGAFDIAFNYSIDTNGAEIFVQNAELYTHGFNAPDLGMGPYRNAVIINTILGYEYYKMEENVTFQKFGV
ncbi:lysine N(6)-hydroxylase/L-ornithine N(5)-oxygenase family protein [Parafilimonas sp.]|uniref:lysine N(6)-hydroxylase/L-ornithine N(5)-oxygenase family protein n=1 Tax=Parafilimonas sp. TaxID=1969739 RepID=UPI0039E2CA85